MLLPTPLTSLIGRDAEVRAVLDLVERPYPRLLTLTGPGGAGKTRLALAISARLLDRFADGVFFVDLSALRDPALVTSTIARSVGVHETGDEALLQTLSRHLSTRELLLVLDNFEQLLPAAPIVADLLHACPRLKVLVTSRAALRLSGEHEVPVPPLAVPDLRQLPEIEVLTQYEAVALFLQRAQAVRPDFQVTTANAAVIAELCTRLDGLPLAIELAAARVKLLSPQALLARLGNRLALLTGGSRDRPARQQTLRGTIDWSYELLDPGAQRLFTQLAVFAGGATLDSIEAVCGEAASGDLRVSSREPSPLLATQDAQLATLDGLTSLADESLLRQADRPTGEPHFDMLETIREYALERLEASGEADRVRERHARHYLAVLEAAEAGLKGPEQPAWLGRLELENDNARAALSWAIQGRDATLALRLGGALGPFWQMHDHLAEGQAWLEQALALSPEAPADIRARALTAGGGLAFLRGDMPRAIAWQQESLELWRQLGESFGMAAALHNLGRAVHYQARYDEAARLYQETLALRRQIDDRRGLAATLNSLGVLNRDIGDDATARALYEESLGLYRELQDLWGQALLLNNMARLTRDAHALAQTRALCTESLDLFAALGDKHGITWVLSNLSIVAQRQGAVARAARLIGATEAVRETLGAAPLSLSPGERAIYEASILLAREALGADAFSSLQAGGRCRWRRSWRTRGRPPRRRPPPRAGSPSRRQGWPRARRLTDRPARPPMRPPAGPVAVACAPSPDASPRSRQRWPGA
jgi:predicted ATPase